jgi:pyruvate/2-oxoglutarate dehydrogenase complex dihydrolipoamide acyltransferase (E2) component
MDIIGTYDIQTFPKSRNIIINALEEGLHKHYVHIWIELDVTKGKDNIKKFKKNKGKKLSFTGWIVKCISQAVSEHKYIHAYRQGRNKIIQFDDIDISILVEKRINGEKIPLPYIVRKTNEKDIYEINNEIRHAQDQDVDNGIYVLGKDQKTWTVKLVKWAPNFLQKFVLRRLRRHAFMVKKSMGTVMVTSVGMFGKFPGWAIPIGIHTLFIVLGGIIKKPVVIDNEIMIRDVLSLAISVDHDIIDGGPLISFIGRLTELVENAYGFSKT